MANTVEPYLEKMFLFIVCVNRKSNLSQRGSVVFFLMQKYTVERTLKDNEEQSLVLLDENLQIVEEVALFLHYLENKGRAKNTIDSYCRCLRVFFEWLSKEKIKFYEVTKRDMIQLIEYIKSDIGSKEDKSARTVNKYLAAIASFYRYFEGIGGYIVENPITIKEKNNGNTFLNHKVSRSNLEVNFFRQTEKKNTRTKRLFRSQIDKLYKGIESTSRDTGIITRNKLMFRIMYESGIRISELLGLRLLDYSEPNPTESIGTIYVREHSPLYHKDHSLKTTERDIPVSMELIFAIDDYVISERPQKDEIDTIFVNHGSNNFGKYMIRSTAEKIFKILSDTTGIRCTPHMLRHTHGTELKENGYSEIYIMDRLGHESVTSTEKYMHISYEAQAKAYETFMQYRKVDLQNE